MRKVMIIIISISLSLPVFSQVSRDADGRYTNADGTAYSGTYTEYYANGAQRLVMNLKNGLPDGQTTLYYPNGDLKEVRGYKNGKKHGNWTQWSPGEVKTSEAHYTMGFKSGEWKIRDKDGNLIYRLVYDQKENRTGIWKRYNKEGKVVETRSFITANME